jgi:pimeloyl-ACP methyl ester carboxylesterase
MIARSASLACAALLLLHLPIQAAAQPELALTPCELRGSQGYGRVAAECATLRVAENPAEPDGRQIELFVTRIRALGQNPAPDPLTVINGGPGASSVDLYVDLQAAFAPVRRERDIVIVDQRGTGRSSPLTCEMPAQPISAFDAAVVDAATARCLDTLSADPRFYTTTIAVADLERVRTLLGYPRLNLYGVSYGTRVAQHYLRRYPHAVRSMVLDGVLAPDQPLGPDIAVNAQQALDAIFARCADQPHCRSRFPDPAAQFGRLAGRLRSAPLHVDLPDPLTGRPATTRLTYGHLAATVRMLSYAPESAALVPLVLDEAEARQNFTPLALHASRIERELGSSINLAMHNSVVCSEDVPFYANLKGLWPELERTYLGTDQVRMLQTICAHWPRGPVDTDLREPLRSDTPVLLLSGERDPVTPPAYADRVAATLRSSRHVVAPGQGHGVAGRGCIPELIGDFVRTGTTEGLDTRCVARLAPDPFFVDLMGPPP